jgi:NADH dehydrogenase/NADH:ubiquinone oxidoreductase subunit G
MAHAYERQGSLINLAGRIQSQAGGAAPPPQARADWGIVVALAQALGVPGPLPTDLDDIRGLMAADHPALAEVFAQEPLVARA